MSHHKNRKVQSMNSNNPKKRRGAPPPTGLEDRKNSGALCTATRRDGAGCTNFAINGARVCRMHGGAAPQVRAAAQVRILMASDLAAKKLIDLMSSPKVDDRVKLAAARDLLDRANLAGTQNIEIGVTKRTFEDFVGETLVDMELEETDDIEDAEIVEDAPATEEQRRLREVQAAERAREHRRLGIRTLGRSELDPGQSAAREASLAEEAEALARADSARAKGGGPTSDRYPQSWAGDTPDPGDPEGALTREELLLRREGTAPRRRTISPDRWAKRNPNR